MKIYNVGLIGAGFMGRTHAWCWNSLPYFYAGRDYKCCLKGICTSSLEAARNAREELGFMRAYADFQTMIDDPGIDIIDIALPNNVHKEALQAAAKAGKVVYCDKPLTGNLEEAIQLEKELKDPDSLGQMALQYRFYPATMRARQLVEADEIGKIISFRAAYLHSGNVAEGKPMHWKDTRAAGGGVLCDMGTHIIDLLTWLCNAPLSRIYALQKTLYANRPSHRDPAVMARQDTDDMTLMAVMLDGGAIGSIEASKIATGCQDELRFEIHGSRGALRFNLMEPNYLDFFSSSDPEAPLGGLSGFKRIHCVQRYESPALFPGSKFSIGWLRGHLHCLYSFISAHHVEQPFQPSIKRGIELEKMIAAVEKSVADNKEGI
ncbi:MAG: Gfo/Idh/MocA family oxidoreductase [bacterium]|jgi:predicted dehydrogenase|nr:Gfo/Idh/MocA family oxidoreductase [bacterium]MDD3804953.1 Gfo/Idh/MocA family oxidoreductase [bacterium]MDD4152621.1 Gfo/Idh/MocA family oxidoreductase [bacterium]MDD4558590.1 Gfo/Idh/MocA family oxidoreductase [bacterium]